MATSPIEFVYCQIEVLLSNISKKNFRQTVSELNSIHTTFGQDAEIFTLRYLFSRIDFQKSDKQATKENNLVCVLQQEYPRILNKPDFLTLIKNSLDYPLENSTFLLKGDLDLEDVFACLKFSIYQSFIFAVIAKSCQSKIIQKKSITYITEKLNDFNSDISKNETSILDEFIANLSSESSVELLHFILTDFFQNSVDQIPTNKLTNYIFESFRKIYPKQRTPNVLLNLLYPEYNNQSIINYLTPKNFVQNLENHGETHVQAYESDGENFIAEYFRECDWISTKNMKIVNLVFKEIHPSKITPKSIAKTICMFMVPLEKTDSQYNQDSLSASIIGFDSFITGIEKTPSSEPSDEEDSQKFTSDDWNLKNFIQAINELSPGFDWSELIIQLDCSEFYVYDARSLTILKNLLSICFDNDDEVMIKFFYRPWNNAFAQYSLLKYCLVNPGLSPLNRHPFKRVETKELSFNPGEKNLTSNLWENIDYVEALLELSTKGLFREVADLLRKGFITSPEVLTLNLLSIEKESVCRTNLLREAFIYFCHNRRNSQTILRLAWTKTQLQPVLLASCLQFIEDLTSQQKKKQQIIPVNTDTMPSLSNFIEILATLPSINLPDTKYRAVRSTGSHPSGILHTLLGTPIGSSLAVASLLPLNSITAITNEIIDVDALNDIKPSMMLAIDLALILFIQMANAVSALNVKTGKEDPIQQQSVTSMHNVIKNFLTLWFKEQLMYDKNADEFSKTIVKYLKTRYPNITPKMDKLQSTIGSNHLYPQDLRSPSLYLLKHIIESAISAINSNESKVSSKNLAVVNKTLSNLLFHVQSSSNNQKNILSNAPGHQQNFLGRDLSNVNLGASSPSDIPGSNQSIFNTNNSSRAILRGCGDIGIAKLNQSMNRNQSLFLEPGQVHQDLPMSLIFENESTKPEMPKEIELEVDKFFVKLLEGKDMVATVFEYATRGNPLERRILEGILPMLAEEVSLHLPEYPHPMLPYICQLYGSILSSGIKILSRRGLAMMWKALLNRFYLLPPDVHTETPIFKELVQILIKAKNAFTQFYNLPGYFVNCPIFRNFPVDLQNWITNAEYIAKSQLQQQCKMASSPVNVVPDPPDESTTNRISFLFNNLTNANLREKCNELSTLLEDSTISWFAYYLVTKRVVSETSYHETFSNILNHLQDKHTKLRPKVITELIRNIKLIFANIRVDKDDLSARRSLQNLGQFLGYVTLLVNKPILHDDLNMKDLIYEAYYKGNIFVQYAIPFVSRVIKSAAKSVVFKPPNPWTMGLLKVLREYYDMREVVAKLKFEIEILFKEFNLGIDDVQMTFFLRDTSYSNHLEIHLCDFVNDKPVMPSDFQVDQHAPISQSNSQAIIMRPPNQLATLPTNHTLPLSNMLSPGQPGVNQNDITPTTQSLSNSTAQVPFTVSSMQRQVSVHQLSTISAMNQSRSNYPFPMMQHANHLGIPVTQMDGFSMSSNAGNIPGSNQLGHNSLVSVQNMSNNSSSLRYKDVEISIVLASANIEEIIQQLIANGTKTNALSTALMLLEAKPELRTNIQSAVESTIAELVPFAFERCHRITVMTASSIVKKDFALDPDPARIRIAGCLMVRHLASSISLVTARDALNQNLIQNIKQTVINTALGGNFDSEKETVDLITHSIVAKCMPTSLAYMQKTVAEMVVKEMERALENEIKTRNDLGKNRYLECARLQISQQQTSMPEILKLPKILSHADMMVYEDFRRFIPGFSAGSSVSTLASTPTPPIQTSVPPTQQLKAALLNQPQGNLTSRLPTSQTNTSATPGLHIGSSIVSSVNPYSTQLSARNVYDTSITQVERYISVINTFATNNNQTEHPVLKSALENLKCLVEFLIVSKNALNQPGPNQPAVGGNSASGSNAPPAPTPPSVQPSQATIANNCSTLINMLIRSLLQYYRTSLWKDIPQGSEILDIFKEAYMSMLSHLPVPYTWVTRQVTNSWIELSNEIEIKDMLPDNNKPILVKWNWEAFSEFLKIHVMFLSIVDQFLAEQVANGYEPAINFVLDLLDNLVLPQPLATVNPSTKTDENQFSLDANNTKVQSKPVNRRKFTVLNEFDLWCTLEALRVKVNQMSSTVTTPISTRMKVTCARVRAILDLGLMESNPLFNNTSQSEYHPISPPAVSALYAGCSQARQFDDTKSLQENTEFVIQTWFDVCSQQINSRTIQAAEQLFSKLSSFLTSEHQMTGFFRIATVLVIEKAHSQLRYSEPQKSHPLMPSNPSQPPTHIRITVYPELDAFAKLIALIIKRSGKTFDDFDSKILVLNKVLGIIAGTLLHEYEVLRNYLHPMPFERILIMIFNELHSPALSLDPNIVNYDEKLALFPMMSSKTQRVSGGSDQITNESSSVSNKSGSQSRNCSGVGTSNLSFHQQIPLAYAHLLHLLRPEKATIFVFSWLEILAHRYFVGKTLAASPNTTPTQLRITFRAMYAQLMVDLLKFLGFFLQNAIMPKPIQCLYKATLRLLVVLTKDFPEFVSDYYPLFCDVVPTNSIQMRNLILVAPPKRGMVMDDFLQAPSNDLLTRLEDPNGYCMSAGSRLPTCIRQIVDSYLANRQPQSLLADLVAALKKTDDFTSMLPSAQKLTCQSSEAVSEQFSNSITATTVIATPLVSDKMSRKKKKELAVHQQAIETTASMDQGQAQSNQNLENNSETAKDSKDSSDSNNPLEQSESIPNVADGLWNARSVQQLAAFGVLDEMHYNVQLMTNLVLYIGITAISHLRSNALNLEISSIVHTPQMDIIKCLVNSLDNEGRYLFLNCMANQLRYPNTHTYYFSFVILHLFSHNSEEAVKEQISRVLMERLIVNHPHPWGLLMTSAELLRNPVFGFWEHDFARCNSEIETIVTIVASSCIPNFKIPYKTTAPSGIVASSGNGTATGTSPSSANNAPGVGPNNNAPAATAIITPENSNSRS